MDDPENFVDEIAFDELHFIEIIGRGAFGVVSRAQWRGIDVAVKHIETEKERKAFNTELKQLSRVSHPNIVHLYGACKTPKVCLVMEYAEGGSLYNVLHTNDRYRVEYTVAHALSWLLQCAKGVEYLHGMKPKALVHRDLKPPNLLLVSGGTHLKICDFGTACDIHTVMTTSKGSAAWMAPEVFASSTYTEMCDVYSWGIILWEVLTRRKPFEEFGSSFRIMWGVHQGTRPPLIRDCPKAVETIMTRSWSPKSMERPSMGEIVRVMTKLCQLAPGADEPILYPACTPDTPPTATAFDTPPPTFRQDTVRPGDTPGEPVLLVTPRPPPSLYTRPIVVEVGLRQPPVPSQRQTSAPPSLAASREHLVDKSPSSRSSTPVDVINKRYSADPSLYEGFDFTTGFPKAQSPAVRGHRRTGSHGTAITQSQLPVPPTAKGHRRTGSYGNTPQGGDLAPPVLVHISTAPGQLVTHQSQPNVSLPQPDLPQRSVSWAQDAVLADLSQIDVDLQPMAPCPTSQESVQIYEDHVQLAHMYLQIQSEIQQLEQEKQQLQMSLDAGPSNESLIRELTLLQRDNEALQEFYDNLKKQAEVIFKDPTRQV